MSARARRFFGCVLPVAVFVFGCGAMGMLGYAGQIIVQVVRVRDLTMAPVLMPGWTVLVNNTAFWAREPVRGSVVTVGSPNGISFRRVHGLPGETIEIREGKVFIDGEPTKVRDRSHGSGPDYGPVRLGTDEYFVLAEDRNADDSRVWGPARREQLYGVALFYFPEGSHSPYPVAPTPTPEGSPGRPDHSGAP